MKNWEKVYERIRWRWMDGEKKVLRQCEWDRNTKHEMKSDSWWLNVTSSSYSHSIFSILLFSKVSFGINNVLVVPSDYPLLLLSSLIKRFRWLRQTSFYPGERTFVHCVALFFIAERWYSLWRRRMKTLSIVLLLCFDAETNSHSNPFRGGCQVKPFNASYLFAQDRHTVWLTFVQLLHISCNSRCRCCSLRKLINLSFMFVSFHYNWLFLFFCACGVRMEPRNKYTHRPGQTIFRLNLYILSRRFSLWITSKFRWEMLRWWSSTRTSKHRNLKLNNNRGGPARGRKSDFERDPIARLNNECCQCRLIKALKTQNFCNQQEVEHSRYFCKVISFSSTAGFVFRFIAIN